MIVDAIKTYNRPIHMIVGGLHLNPTRQQPATETVDFISRRMKPTPKFVLPLHCTGMEARAMLRHALADGCVPAGVGMKVVVQDDEAEEGTIDGIEPDILP